MKRLAYLIALFGLLLTSCTDEDSLSNPPTGNNDKTVFQFSVNMPEYTSVRTRAAINENAVNDLWLNDLRYQRTIHWTGSCLPPEQ